MKPANSSTTKTSEVLFFSGYHLTAVKAAMICTAGDFLSQPGKSEGGRTWTFTWERDKQSCESETFRGLKTLQCVFEKCSKATWSTHVWYWIVIAAPLEQKNTSAACWIVFRRKKGKNFNMFWKHKTFKDFHSCSLKALYLLSGSLSCLYLSLGSRKMTGNERGDGDSETDREMGKETEERSPAGLEPEGGAGHGRRHRPPGPSWLSVHF